MPSQIILKNAIKKANTNNNEARISACLYKGGSILRVVCNENRTLTYRRKYFAHGIPTRHAEMNVIHGIPRDVISKCSMLVVRIDKKGNLKSAKPCIACATALYDSGIKKVFYSNYSGEILKLDFNELVNGHYTKEHFHQIAR